MFVQKYAVFLPFLYSSKNEKLDKKKQKLNKSSKNTLNERK